MQVRKIAANMVWLIARFNRVSTIEVRSPQASLVKHIYTN
jgi:hypothetical protein